MAVSNDAFALERKLTDTQLESESGEAVASLLTYCVMLVKAIGLSGARLSISFFVQKEECCCWLMDKVKELALEKKIRPQDFA